MSKIRAWSVLDIKSINDDERTFEGIASTPATDRMEDIVEPMGAQFTLPIPLLWQHGRDAITDPIGWVTSATPTKNGIPVKGQFAKPEPGDPPSLVEDLNRAWALVKKKLVRGLSIGFNPLEWSDIKGTYGLRYTKWDWLELSAVAIPANAEASITSVKSADQRILGAAVRANEGGLVVRCLPSLPGDSGQPASQPINQSLQGAGMKTIQERIAAFTATRGAKVARMNSIMAKADEEQRTLNDAEKTEYDGVKAEVKEIDEHLARLKEQESFEVASATPVVQRAVATPAGGAAVRTGAGDAGGGGASGGGVARFVSVTPNVEKGIRMARWVMAQLQAKGNLPQALSIIQSNKNWMDQTPELEIVARAAVAAGDTTTAGWASELVYNQNLVAEFIELLRPATVLGRIPGLRRVPFNIRVGSQTAGSTGYWVGQAKPIPVSKLTTGSLTLDIAKAAGLLVIDQELARSSAPSAELLVRDDLIKTNAEFIDVQLLDPNIAAVANVNPASITNGVTPQAASGTAAANLRADVKAMLDVWLQNNLDPSKGVWIMPPTLALSISLMLNALGQPEFPGITMNGGTFIGLPVITSMSANIPGSPDSGNMLILLNAPELLLADDGAMTIEVSNQAAIEMSDAPSQSGASGTGAQMVSMFQTESLAIKGIRFINWKKRRSTAVVYVKEAAYSA